MAKIENTRIVKSKFCRQLAENIRQHGDSEGREIAENALRDVLVEEQIFNSLDTLTVCEEFGEALLDVTYLAERLVNAAIKGVSEYISHIGDEIAEAVEC